MEETWGQWTIRFCDLEDNLIEIGESIPCFVRRLADSGMTDRQIFEKTTVPLDTIKEYLDTQERTPLKD